MWLTTQIRLYRALRRYRTEKNIKHILREDWGDTPALQSFFEDIDRRLYGEEQQRLQQKQAEFMALQNQINPHFLYNSLEAIRADALIAGCGDIAETTEALATFYRYTISNVRQSVTFSDELDNVENYFTVQKCRFGDKISLEVDLENEELLRARMPKLILQPLVENAVVHGLEGKVGGGTVRILVDNSGETLFIRIRDNGIGMPEEMVARLNSRFLKENEQTPGDSADPAARKGGIALVNVNSRIRLMFGDDYGLSILSVEGIGSECCLTLPLRYESYSEPGGRATVP